MTDFTTKPLTPDTWPAFAALVERHNGVWSGCWCLGFHAERETRGYEVRRELKFAKLQSGETQSALVFAGETCVGWCQFGPAETLQKIKNKKAYDAGATALPNWRITCFFVDRQWRGKGVAAVALAGAVEQIAQLGGGSIESYPEEVEGRSTSSSFLHHATLGMFERLGFARDRKIGKDRWVVRRTI
jgi:GNAT superfamily N-acetyltransferase